MRDLANIWIGCGCVSGLVVGVGGLAILTASGGQGAVFAGLALLGIGAYFLWTYRTNHYDEHGCRIEYLYTDNAYPKQYTRSQVGRDIPRGIAERHPDHILDS
jgi:hypothetical protein